MIEQKNFLRKPMLIKDFLEMSCLFLIVTCLVELMTRADIFIVILCVTVVLYIMLQVTDVILQKQDDKNKETWK